MKKDCSLSNKSNKQRFITLLALHLKRRGIGVLHAGADADVLVVQTAVASAERHNTVLVGDDTDLLVLLCSRQVDIKYDIYFRPEPKSNSQRISRFWNIKNVRSALGDHICNNLLFAHAVLGCDTTSRVFGIGKSVFLKKIKSSPFFRQQAEVFKDPQATRDAVIIAGENALVYLFNGKPGEKQDALRVQHLYRKVSSSITCVQPRTLLPTSSVASNHSLPVYHQVQQWNGVYKCEEDWGWKVIEGHMVPVQTDMQPAPAYLLEAINCNCKSNCSTRRCSCVRIGLFCSPPCGKCRGLPCSNVVQPDEESDAEDV